MNRYPGRQDQQDASDRREHGRVAVLRPGARVRVRGVMDRSRGPVVMGVAILARVVDAKVDEVLVSTKEYGRRWFRTFGSHTFSVVEEF